MRICNICWKNLKKEPANVIVKENKKNWLICNECIKKEKVQQMIKNGWSVYLSTPNLDEMGD